MNPSGHAVVLVYGTSHAIRAEQILFKAGIESEMVPVPRHLSSNCGVCLQIELKDVDASRKALEAAKVEIEGIYEVE